MTGQGPPRLSFGSVADRYERARPGYPADAVSWLVGDQQRRVIELGAGTGKLTAALVERDHLVLATDPDERMLHHLRRGLPEAFAVAGVAERIPAAHRSADVVVAAQAFHWFDFPAAVPEIARVLRPGGVLALVWNVRDESIPWVRRLGRLIGPPEEVGSAEVLAGYDQFGSPETATFRHWQTLDRPGLVDLVASRSMVATLPEEERAEVLAEVGALYDGYGRGPEPMMLPYLTQCYRFVVRRAAQPARRDPGEPTQPLSRADLPGATSPTAAPAPRPPDYDDDGIRLIDFS